MKVYSCEEHIEEALEECLEDGGLPPEMTKLDGEKEAENTCFICHAKPQYVIERETA